MPQLQPTLVVRPSAPLGPGATNPIGKRLSDFAKAEQAAAADAAKVATNVSRSNFRYLRNPAGAQRASRESTGGRFPSYLTWGLDAQGQVGLDIEKLPPHWIILEIGTGEKARMRFAGDKDAGVKGTTVVRTVKSQRGRVIHSGLVFADGPGGQYSPPGAARDQQLHARSRIKGAPRTRRGIRIQREIAGQHFVREGAQAGFLQYRRSVLAAARQSFSKGSAS